MKALSPSYRHPRPKKRKQERLQEAKRQDWTKVARISFGDLSSCILNDNNNSINNIAGSHLRKLTMCQLLHTDSLYFLV